LNSSGRASLANPGLLRPVNYTLLQDSSIVSVKTSLPRHARRRHICWATSWNETQTLVGNLANAENVTETRLRIQAALRRIVEAVFLLIVPRGSHRLAAVQIHFTGGKRRDYLIHNRSAENGRGGGAKVASFALGTGDKRRAGKVDLRIKQHTETVAAVLGEIDLAELDEICTDVVEFG
jgi:hypothetical protein